MVLALQLLVVPTASRAQSPARVSGQIVAGTLVTPISFIVGGVAAKRFAERRGASEKTAERAAYISAYTSTWLGAATPPALIGRDGHYAAALGGSLAGLGVAVIAVKAGNLLYDSDRRACRILCWTLGIATIALPSIGATIAYNASAR